MESPTHARWIMVSSIFFVSVLMFIDRVNIAIAAQYIMPEYGLTDVQMGWIFSSFVIGYALLQVPGGMLGDRFGPRIVTSVAVVWWSVFTALTAIAGDWFLASWIGVMGSFILTRVLIGVGEAAAPPNYARLVANWVASDERGLAMGVVTSGAYLGAAIAPPLIVWIMATFGWREAFYLFGGLGVVMGLVSYWFVRDHPSEHRWVNQAELKIIRNGEKAMEPVAIRGATPWRMLLSRRDLWLLTGAYAALGYVGYIFFSWFYLYLVNERGFSASHAGWLSTAPFLVSAVAATTGGWLSDKLSRRFGKRIGGCGFSIGCAILAGALIVAGAASSNSYAAVAFLSFGNGALYLSVAVYWATIFNLAKPYAATVGGMMNMGGHVGGALSPVLTPYLAQIYGWDIALYGAAGVALLCALLWIGINPDNSIVDDQLDF